jgi:hypothetical protein
MPHSTPKNHLLLAADNKAVRHKVGRGGLRSHKQLCLLFHLQHVLAQIGHCQVICEKYTNDDGIL